MINIDGTDYDVRIGYPSITRTFELIEGKNAGTSLAYTRIRDLIGTQYAYTMTVEPNPVNRAAYDSFYEAITAPADYHSVSFPYGQTVLSFQAYVSSGTDAFGGRMAGQNRWSGLSITFIPLGPQK